MSYESLSKHGYRGGPSIFKIPPPKIQDKDQDWSWSTGKRTGNEDTIDETYEERERTRAAANQSERMLLSQSEKILGSVQSNSHPEKKENVSFSQKEKRKRDLGQASRGKNYVEEEKRLLRESGVYSGFDS